MFGWDMIMMNMVKVDGKSFSMKRFLSTIPITNTKGMLQDHVLSKEKMRILSNNLFLMRVLKRMVNRKNIL